MTADFMEAEAAISGPMKVKILSYIFEVVANYEKQIEKAEVASACSLKTDVPML